MKYILRIIVSPAVFVIVFVSFTVQAIKRAWHFVRYGGEFINYKRDERAVIQDVYNHIRDNYMALTEKMCPNCGGKGYVPNYSPNVSSAIETCPLCKGNKTVFSN